MTVPGDLDASRGKTMSESGREEFFRVAKQLKDFYLKVRDDPDHYCLAPLPRARGTKPPLTDPEKTLVIPPVPSPADVASATISSMGRIDKIIARQHGDIEVHSPWVAGEELRSSIGLFLGTFREELSLSVAYNEAWHVENEVIGFTLLTKASHFEVEPAEIDSTDRRSGII
ncbi:unnamed protein product [Clonostachys rhizophaga]|uniref:Uncharacterized protein n=1 Tax=Clonostachys rhizophaga TaxID=160324 RepID=A0A9N9YRZ1_9HYPO|nr:unnamed protein product [Clonostachys rhizophaga]